MARALGGVGVAGSLLTLVWVVLPSPPETDQFALVLLCLLGLTLGLILLSGAIDRAPRVAVEGAVALATVIISVGVYYARVRGTGVGFLYMWCTPYAYCFFPRRRALFQAALVVLGYGTATILASLAHPDLAGTVSEDWGPLLLLAGTVLIVGELVRRLAATVAEGREKFASAFRRAPAPMARIAADGRYVDANEAFCRAVGRPWRELLGMPFMDLVPDDQRALVEDRWARLFSGASPVEEYERDYLRPDGTRVTLVLTNSLLGPPDDPETELFVQALDVTQRRAAEQALRDSERRYRTLVDASQTVVWASDLDGRIHYVNDAVRDVFGYEPDEVRGHTIAHYLPAARAEATREALERLRAGRAVTGEVDVRRADGRHVIMSYSIASLSDEAGAAVGFVGTLLDVTERRRASEALRLSEARQRAVLDNAPAAITICDERGRLLVVNREAARLLDRPAETLAGARYEDVYDEEQAAKLRAIDDAVFRQDAPVVGELTEQLGDEERIFLSVAFPLPVGRGAGRLVCHFSFDVTDRERARRALERSHDERRRLLAELVRAQEDERRRIAADVHDDSIQVLAGVAIRLGMLTQMVDRPDQRRLIEGLDEAVRHGVTSLRQLLFDLRLPALDELGLAAALRSYLSETVAREGVTYALEDHLRNEPPPELRTVLYRVAQEAIANIRKHAHASRVVVTLEGHAGAVSVTVLDDGVGFHVADKAAEVAGHLGLVGMRERIGAAGGWIEVESEPGRGTTVRFGVPLGAAREATPTVLSGV